MNVICLNQLIRDKGKMIIQDSYLGSSNVASPIHVVHVRLSSIVVIDQNVLSSTILLDHSRLVSYTLYYPPRQALQFSSFRTRKVSTLFLKFLLHIGLRKVYNDYAESV